MEKRIRGSRPSKGPVFSPRKGPNTANTCPTLVYRDGVRYPLASLTVHILCLQLLSEERKGKLKHGAGKQSKIDAGREQAGKSEEGQEGGALLAHRQRRLCRVQRVQHRLPHLAAQPAALPVGLVEGAQLLDGG